MKIEFNEDGLDEITKNIIDTEGVRRMQRVADACNSDDQLANGYRVSVEGSKPLRKHDYRATVITATAQAMSANAKRNTLVKNLHQAGGA